MKGDNKKQQYRVNEQIRVPEVRIVGDGIESSVMPTREALRLAEDKDVDLVEISPNAQPPVCRLIDYSKFLYQQKKKAKELKAKQVKVEVKEIRFGPQTGEADYAFKLKHAQRLQGTGRSAAPPFRQRSGGTGKGGEHAIAGRQEDVPHTRSEEGRCSEEEPATPRQRGSRSRSKGTAQC